MRLLVLATLILVLSAVQCTASSPIYVGVITSSSSGFEKDSRDNTTTLSFIFDIINQKGGINGRPIHLVFKDDHNNPEEARKVAEELASDERVKAVIGHGFSACAIAAGDIYRRAGLVCVSPLATNPKATCTNPWMFSILPDDSFRANRIACYLKAVLESQKVIVLSTQSPYGLGLHDAFMEKARRLGISVLDDLNFDMESTDFTRKILKPVNRHKRSVDTIVILAHADEAALATKIIRKNRIETPIILPGMATRDMMETLEGNTKNIFITTPFLLSLGSMEAVQFARQFKNVFGYIPSTAAFLTADAGNLIIKALEAGAVTREAVRKHITSLDSPKTGFHGITGFAYFNKEGAGVRQILLSTLDGNHLMPAFTQIRSAIFGGCFETSAEDPADEAIFVLDGEPLYLTSVVYAGIDISRLDHVDAMSASFSLNFYYWFLWQGKLDIANMGFVNDIQDPGDKTEILRKDLSGKTRYICYRARKTFRFPLDLRDFPFDAQELPVTFAHKWKNANLVRLAVDVPDGNLQSLKAKVPDGWEFLDQDDYTATYSLHTTFGDPRQSECASHIPFSIYRYTARIQRVLLPFYVTLFLPMLILMVMPLAVFWIPLEQVRSRLASLTGSLLSILLFHISLANSHPRVGYLVRADYFFLGAYAVIVALYVTVVFGSAVDKGGHGNRAKAARINRISAWIFFPLIIILEALMMLSS